MTALVEKPAGTSSSRSQTAVSPYVGILGVFLGAGIATLNSRLLSIGLPDLRGALGFGFDEASWLPTALNSGMMFSGVFVCFLAVLFGPRRILFPCAAIFAAISTLLPFATGYWPMLALVTIAGLSSGTFYSLTLTFVLRAVPKKLIIFAVAAYAAEIVFVSNAASLLVGWYIERLSWHWIFWTAAVVTPVMMVCIYFGIPRMPLANKQPSWRGFAYFSLGVSLLYAAMDQGERLDWFHSGVIVAMTAGGIFLVGAAGVRRLIQPNPILNLGFLNRRNTIILSLSIVVFKLSHLATIVLIPNFLGTIQAYRPLDTGRALAWVAVPMFAVVWLVAFAMIFTSSRLTLTAGLSMAAIGCWMCAHMDSTWAGSNFEWIELLLATGFAATYVGLVGNIILEALEAGALTSAADAATISGLMHFVRIFGGQAGVATMTRLITVRERFHSNLLGLHVQVGSWITDERVRLLTAGLLPQSAGPDEAQARAIELMGRQVRGQAFTLAVADGFLFIGCVVVAYLLLMLLLRPAKYSFNDLRKMQ